MAKKRKRTKAKPKRLPMPAKFAVGTEVRVKPGIKDPDFPDIPLGGWSGKIADVAQRKEGPVYQIEWDDRTLEAIHPVYVKRCKRDDLQLYTMSLGENDIEPDTGGPVPIQQPTQIITRPLNPKDQDDRILGPVLFLGGMFLANVITTRR